CIAWTLLGATVRGVNRAGYGWFLVWAVPGVGLGLGLSFALGLFSVPLGLALIVLFWRRIGFSAATYGLLVGMGAVPLWVAAHPHGFNRMHWLAAGAVFVAAGGGGYLRE